MKFTEDGRARYLALVEQAMGRAAHEDPEFLSHLLRESRTGLNEYDDSELIAEGVMRGVGEPMPNLLADHAPFYLPVSIDDGKVFDAEGSLVIVTGTARDYIVKAINAYGLLKTFFESSQNGDLEAMHAARDDLKEMGYGAPPS